MSRVGLKRVARLDAGIGFCLAVLAFFWPWVSLPKVGGVTLLQMFIELLEGWKVYEIGGEEVHLLASVTTRGPLGIPMEIRGIDVMSFAISFLFYVIGIGLFPLFGKSAIRNFLAGVLAILSGLTRLLAGNVIVIFLRNAIKIGVGTHIGHVIAILGGMLMMTSLFRKLERKADKGVAES